MTYHRHFKSNNPIAWSWPLQVAVSPRFDTQFQGEFTERFVELKIIDNNITDVNIVLFSDGIYEALKSSYKNKFHADIVIINYAFIKGEGYNQGTFWDFRSILRQIIKNTGASGVFLVEINQFTIQSSSWFESLIVELSHNKNIVQAIEAEFDIALLYYDPKVEKETKLENVVKEIIHGLKKVIKSPRTTFFIPDRITGNRPHSPRQLAQLLENKLPNFRYSHETGDAIDMALINAMLYMHYKRSAFHTYHKKDKDDDTTSKNYGKVISTIGEILHMDVSYSRIENVSYKEKEVPPMPRFLQTKIQDTEGQTKINFLSPKKNYVLRARIGISETGWYDGRIEFDTDTIFEKSTKEKEPVDLVLRTSDASIQQQVRIFLPRFTNSTEADFAIQSGSEPYFTGEIEAYHNNKLIQKIKLRIRVRNEYESDTGDGLQIKITYCIRTNLNGLFKDTKNYASYTYREEAEKGASLSGMVGGESIPMYFSPGLDDLMKEIKTLIQKAVINLEKYPDDIFHEENSILFRKLAIKGNVLFVQHLRKKQLRGPLQIVTNRPGFVPLDFVYELAPPGASATLCSGAKVALETGKCENCYDKASSPAPHICPLGFWGFSQAIERSAVEMENGEPGDYLIKAQPTTNRRVLQILNDTLYASSIRVDAVVSTIRKDVGETIRQKSKQATEALTWEQWKEITQQRNPDSMILLVHVEKDTDYNEDKIEIGDKEFLLKNFFDTSRIKPIPEKRSPLMVVVGCETSDLENQGFDISSKLIHEGAAIVLSNFTKISGRSAGAITIKLVEYLKDQNHNEVLLGEVLLRLRRHLMVNGIIAGLSLVAYGDANWKLKA